MDTNSRHYHSPQSRAAEALQRAQEERARRKADERRALEDPPRRGIDLATHQVSQGIFEIPHPQLHLGDINAEINQRVHEQAEAPQIVGFQPVNRPNSEAGHWPGPDHSPAPAPAPQQGVNPPGTPGPPPTFRVTPPMGYFSLPPERPKSMGPPLTPPQALPVALPRPAAPPTPVSRSASSSQESSDTQDENAHKTFTLVTIHTAKCDVCNRHNKATLHRCKDCGWQICTPCWDMRGGNGDHFHRRKFAGPTFGSSQAKKDKGKVKEVQKDQKTPNTPRVQTPAGRTRSTPVRTPRGKTRNTPVRPAQRAQRLYLEPRSEIHGHETDDTLSYIDDNDNRPPTRGKGKGMGRVDEDGDVAMSGLSPARPLRPDSEEQRRLDAAIGLLMLEGHVPRGPPAQEQDYPRTPVLNRPAEDTHPNPTYRDLSAGAAARFDALLAAAEQVLGNGLSAQSTQGAPYAETGPSTPQYTVASQSPTNVQAPMDPPLPGQQRAQAQTDTEYNDTGSHQQQPSPQTAPNSQVKPDTGLGARRGIPARAAATRRTLPVPEHPEPLWTREWFNTVADHLTELQRIGLAPQNREFTRLDAEPQAAPPEVPPNAVYERRYNQWLTPDAEAEARLRAATAILRGEVPVSTTGVPGFGPAQNGGGTAAPSHAAPNDAGYYPTGQNSASNTIDASSNIYHQSASSASIFGHSPTTTASPAQDHNMVIPARRSASDTFSTNSHDPKRQAVETATGIEAVPASSATRTHVPVSPVSVGSARSGTQIPGLGHLDRGVMDVDSGFGQAQVQAPARSRANSRARAWEL